MLNSTEDAKNYLDEVRKHLKELTEISIGAGLYRHASIWVAIESAFLESTAEVEIIADMINLYLRYKLGLGKDNKATDKERFKKQMNDILKYMGAVHKIGNNPPEPIEFEAYKNNERPGDDRIREQEQEDR